MIIDVEIPIPAHHRIGGMKIAERNVIPRDRDVGRMRAPRLQQLRQEMRMQPRGRNAARVRPADLLEDLDAADASQGDAMEVCPPHRVACRIAGIEPAAAGKVPGRGSIDAASG
ncbi:hypothetical protein GCM10007923_35350 [Shinella yambaruensis]|uniref:Uncharacterized protein n=1 Tax=Shinella yambaruensis TaxID=415996 RepID=A0ABQ5ZL00_9HYPH|nr:hypothetical protein GCM10007923_35350 [Shinella yambaruensis]